MSSTRKRQHAQSSSDSKVSKKVKVEVLSEDDDDDYYYNPSDYYEEDSDVTLESDEEEYSPTAKTGKSPRKGIQTSPKKKEKKEPTVKVASKAAILSLATDVPPEAHTSKDRLSAIDTAVISRIKKALSLGTHEGTGEAEAKAAMRLAAKLMAQHNVDQADILAAEDSEEQLKRAGQSTVAIRSTSDWGGVIMHAWTSPASTAIQTFFDCKCYSTSMHDRIDWTFYGLAEQTVAAAYAFEMVYNLILTWSAQNKAAKGRSGKNNYCFGVADGLLQMAKKERKEEEKLAIKKEKTRLELAANAEKEEREKELQRLTAPEQDRKPKFEVIDEIEDGTGNVKAEQPEDREFGEPEPEPEPPYSWPRGGDSDSDYGADNRDDFEYHADFDDEDDMEDMLREFDRTGRIKTEPRPIPAPKVEDVEPKVKVEEEDTPWTSAGQLTLFRDNAMTIADEYLEKSKLKLRSRRKYNGPNFSKGGYGVYLQGKDDAKKIDIKRKRIKASEHD